MEKKEMIYRFLCAGKHASEIAKELKISRQYISVVIEKLKQSGHILCSNKKGKPKFYEKTKRKFTPVMSTSISPVMSTRLLGRSQLVEIQKTSFKFKINRIALIKRRWDSEVNLKNNVKRYIYKHPFENIGEVVFDYYHSKNKDVLLIILPRIMVTREEIENKGADLILNDYAMRSGAWFQKKFKMSLGLPEKCQKPHYAVPLKETLLIDAVHEGTYKVGDIMLDMSPPDRIPEYESTNPNDVLDYIDSIKTGKDNRLMITKLANKIGEINELVGLHSKDIIKLYGICDGLTNNQGMIIKYLEKEKGFGGEKPAPDEKIDVA